MPPAEVDGNACSNWFTCSPRPVSSSRTHVEFAGLKFAAAHGEKKYKACWCPVNCALAEHWHEAPLSSIVEHAGFSWLAEAQPASFGRTELRVARRPFTSYTHSEDWRLRFERPDLGCQFRTASAICAHTGEDCGLPKATTLDEAVWDVEIEFDVRGGAYKVCISEDGSNYVEVPSKDSRYFLITTRFSAAERLYQHQYFSGKVGQLVKLFAQGSLALPTQSKLGLASLEDGCRANATLLGTLRPGQTPAGELLFEADLGDLPHVVAGEYAVCFCDALKDAADGGLRGTDASTYVVEPFFQVLGSPPAAQNSPDQCARKCGQGCLGPTCYCDDYFDAKRAASAGAQEESFADVLCLPHRECRDLCEFMGAECAAYSVDRTGLNLCWISGSAETRDQQRGVQTDTWTKQIGEACTSVSDFFPGSRVGTLAVTERVDLQVDYVVEPDSLVSLEVTGSDLSEFTDRIMVVPSYE